MPTITGTVNADELGDTLDSDVIDALGGADIVTVRSGSDSVNGGAGTDTFVLRYGDTTLDVTGGALGTGFYTGSADRQVLFTGFELFDILTGSGNDTIDTAGGNDIIRTGAGSDTIDAGGGNDFIDGGAGGDLMRGGAGDDVYVVDSAEDVVTELAGEGTDEIRTSLSTYVLSGNLENLTYTGSDSANLRGNAGSNVITGGTGNDFFQLQDGGSDRVIGVGGQFTANNYYFGDALDVTDRVIGADSSFDQVLLRGQISLVFGAGMFTSVETIALVSRADTFFGVSSDSFSYTLTAHDSNLAAGKQMVVDGRVLLADERVDFDGSAEKDGSFLILGGRGNDRMIGGAGNDEFLGSLGNDVMIGGLGNDSYNVDSLGDQVTELANQGTDTILTSLLNYTLAANVEDLIGTAATGQRLIGNDLNNRVTGRAGNDNLAGGAGNDTLIGGAGSDILDGGVGFDRLEGGIGVDIYYVDAGDLVIEAAADGAIDYVRARTSYGLTSGSHVEVLTTADYRLTTRIDLTGNEFNNAITGSNGVNSLRGGGGDDTLRGLEGDDMLDGGTGRDLLFGGIGNDIYYVDADDRVHEAAGEGVDYVWARTSFTLSAGSHVEVLGTADFRLTARIDLTGNEFNNSITGNNGINHLGGEGGGDTLRGLDGNDVLDGGTGGDLLFGGNGNDSFAFTTALGNGNVDTIADFGIGDDQILLSGGAGQPFAALAEGALEASSFVVGTRAADADDRIIYNSQTGQLFYDADGSGAGAAVLFATVTANTPLSAADFLVI